MSNKKISDVKSSKKMSEIAMAKIDDSVDPLNLDTIESQDIILCEYRKYEHCQLMLLTGKNDDRTSTLHCIPKDTVDQQSS